jgi:dihydrofolate reductase
MSKVIANMCMSLDGFIADPNDGCDELFGWYGNGNVATETAVDWATFMTSQASADVLKEAMASAGALIAGRHLFDITGGWGGMHPIGAPVFVVSHRGAPEGWEHDNFTFVTDGLESAVKQAQAVAGDKNVVIASAKIARQALDAGLLDEISVSLVPVLLGKGIPWFENLESGPVRLADPEVIQGTGVTHLVYQVRR